MQINEAFLLISFGLSLNVVWFILSSCLMVIKYQEQEGKLCALAGLVSIFSGIAIIFFMASLVKIFSTIN